MSTSITSLWSDLVESLLPTVAFAEEEVCFYARFTELHENTIQLDE